MHAAQPPIITGIEPNRTFVIGSLLLTFNSIDSSYGIRLFLHYLLKTVLSLVQFREWMGMRLSHFS